MLLYHCQLTFHDYLYYETRTQGRLYETGRLLHNIALCYALGFAQTTYHHDKDTPNYAEEIEPLNEAGIYITPAGGHNVKYVINIFKLGDERTFASVKPNNANIPTYGRAKEIDIGCRFSFGVLSERALQLPIWVRMGLWLSKGRLDVSAPMILNRRDMYREETIVRYPLNPADLPASAELRLFDLVSMRPSSLIENALIASDTWWECQDPDGAFYLPAGMRHEVGS